jgi:hypothetical protein
MPILVAIVVISFVAGLVANRATARLLAVALAVVANGVFVWSIADGKGDDPAWILLLSIAAGTMSVAAAHVAGTLRVRRRTA